MYKSETLINTCILYSGHIFNKHGDPITTVESNKNITISSFESSEKFRRQRVGHIAQFRIMNPHQ